MKIELRLRSQSTATLSQGSVERVGGDHRYAPLALPHLLARRIEVSPTLRHSQGRRYPWKREDESVN